MDNSANKIITIVFHVGISSVKRIGDHIYHKK